VLCSASVVVELGVNVAIVVMKLVLPGVAANLVSVCRCGVVEVCDK
jgi:hypothetical protein